MGINDFSNKQAQINIYPNPASSIVTVNAKNINQLTLFNVVGNLITTTNKNQIDVSNFNDGVYFIQVQTNTASTTQKIIVQH